jgi:hypothetical protein
MVATRAACPLISGRYSPTIDSIPNWPAWLAAKIDAQKAVGRQHID